MQTLTSTLRIRLIDAVKAPARSIRQSLAGIQKMATRADNPIGTRLQKSIRTNEVALRRAQSSLFGAAAGFYALKTAIGAPVIAAGEFESAMADVNKVVDFKTPAGFKEFQKELFALSRQVPTTVNGLAQIAAAAGQSGIKPDNIIEFTEAAAKIGVAFDLSADKTGVSLAKLKTALGLSIDETILLADSMNHLSNIQASTAPDILDVVRRVGAQGKVYGYSAEQVVALGSAMVATGAETNVAATSIRNMGRALTRGETATKRQRRGFQKLGIDSKELADSMQKDAVGTTERVLNLINQLPKAIQAAVTSDVFGDEVRALGPLITNMSLLTESFDLVSDSAKFAGSAFKEFEVRNATFDARVSRFKNVLYNLKVVIGNALIPAVTSLMESLMPVIGAMIDFSNAHPALIRNIAMATLAVFGFKIAMDGLRFIGLLGKGGALNLMAIGFNTIGRSLIFSTHAAREAIRYQTALAAASLKNGKGVAKFGKAQKAMVGAQAALLAISPRLVMALGSAAAGIGAVLAGITAPAWGLIAAALLVIAGVGLLIYKNWKTLKGYFRGMADELRDQFAPAIGKVTSTISNMFDVLEKRFPRLGAMVKKIREYRSEIIKGAVTKAKGWMKSLTNGEQGNYDDGYSAGRAYVRGLFKAGPQIKTAFLGFLSPVAPLVLGLKQVTSSVTTMLSNVMGKIGDMKRATVKSFQETMRGYAESFGRFFSPAFNLFSGGYSIIKNFFDGAVKGFEDMMQWLSDIPRMISEAIGGAIKMPEIKFPKFKMPDFDFFNRRKDDKDDKDSKDAARGSENALAGRNAAHRYTTALSRGLGGVKDVFASLWASAGVFPTDIGLSASLSVGRLSVVTEALANVTGAVSGLFAGLTKSVKDSVSLLFGPSWNLTSRGESIMQSFMDGMAAKFASMLDWIKSIPGLISEALSGSISIPALQLPKINLPGFDIPFFGDDDDRKPPSDPPMPRASRKSAALTAMTAATAAFAPIPAAATPSQNTAPTAQYQPANTESAPAAPTERVVTVEKTIVQKNEVTIQVKASDDPQATSREVMRRFNEEMRLKSDSADYDR